MSFRKFRANNIFTGTKMLDENHVLITYEKGEIENIVDEKDAGEDVQKLDGIISPAFINCHCHLELSHMKNIIPEKTGLVDFVLNILQHRNFPEEKVLEAIEKAEDEMLQNGIIAVGDICNTSHTISQKAKQRLRYYNFIETSGFIPQFAETRFEQAKNIYEQFTSHDSRFAIHASIVPHAPYSVSKELFELIDQFSTGKISTIHNQESLEEEKFFKIGKSDFEKLYRQLNIDISFFKASKKSSLQTFLPLLKEVSQLLLVHDTFMSEEDILFSHEQSAMSNQQLYFCICANANLYIENNLPPIDLLRKNNCTIVLGTDSLASNHSLNILDEIKTIIQNFPAIPKKEILQWATLNGAKALEMNDELGSFEKGKTPGIILINDSIDEVKSLF